jgi:hypothetical protein
MTDLNEMRRRRTDLDRQIREAELASRAAWNDGLGRIAEAVEACVARAGLETSERTRKSVTILDCAGQVTVQLGYEEPDYSRWLEVSVVGGVSVTFGTDVLPPVSVVVALVRELLLTAQTPAS